jgi:hypothetical protein
MECDAGGTERLVVEQVLTSFDNENEIRYKMGSKVLA